MRLLKKLGTYCLVGSMVLGLSGCGKKDKYDDLYADPTEVVDSGSAANTDDKATTEKAKSDTDELLEGMDKAEENGNKFQYELEGDGYGVTFDAEFEDSSIGECTTYEVDAISLDEEMVVGIAEKLFDDGQYQVIKPYELSTIEELNEDKKIFENIISECGWQSDMRNETGGLECYVFVNLSLIDYYISNYTGENVSTEQGPIYNLVDTPVCSIMQGPRMMWKTHITGERGMFYGRVNGKPWMLEYQHMLNYKLDNGAFVGVSEFNVDLNELVAFDMTQFTISSGNAYIKLDGPSEVDDLIPDEVVNGVDEAKLEDVNRFKEVFGIEDYEIGETGHKVSIVISGTGEVSGYGIMLQPHIGDNELAVWKVPEASTISWPSQFYCYASVGEEGVDYFKIGKLYESKVLEEKKKIMSREEATETVIQFFNSSEAKEYIEWNFNEIGGSVKHPKITEIKLEDIVYTDASGKKICSPAWVYYWNIGIGDSETNIGVAVSATDGTVVTAGAADGEYNAVGYGFDDRDMLFNGWGWTDF